MPQQLGAAATTLLLGTLGMSLQRRPQAEVQALHKPAFQLLCTAAASANAAAAPANAAANAAPAAPPLPGATEVPPRWRAPSLLPISPLVPIAGLPLPTPISSPTSISPNEMGLEDGCEIERATSSWLSCEHCLPLPGDPLTCTLHRAGGRVQGTVHRGGPDRRLRVCKQLRRQLADGAQLLEGGEEMCGLLEQEATLTMALLTIAVGRTRYGRTTMAVHR